MADCPPSPRITAVARSCRFSLYNIRRIQCFLTQHATQLLVQVLVISRLDYCNSLLAGLLTSATKLLQCTQNAAALVFNPPKMSHVTPPPPWLPLASCCSPHTIQDDGTGLQGLQRNCTDVTPNTGLTTCPRASTSLHIINWPAGTAITENKQKSLSKVKTLLCSGHSVVTWTPDQCQDDRVTRHLSKTEDSILTC